MRLEAGSQSVAKVAFARRKGGASAPPRNRQNVGALAAEVGLLQDLKARPPVPSATAELKSLCENSNLRLVEAAFRRAND